MSLDALAEGGLADEPRKRVLVLVNLRDGAVLALAGVLESDLCVSSATCVQPWGVETKKQQRVELYRVASVDRVGTTDVTTGVGFSLAPVGYR